MDVRIETIRDGDEDQRHDLRRQAFGMTDAFDASMPVPDPDRIVAAYDGDDIVGSAVTLDFGMWWSGRRVPCGGVSGVVVRPEARGRGLARSLLRESFERMRARGEVTAALYPTTATLYRSLGFEVCGSYDWRRVPLELVPTGPADRLTWRRVSFDDPALAAVYGSMAPTLDGWIDPDALWWARFARHLGDDSSKNRYAYVGARAAGYGPRPDDGSAGADVAAVAYRYESSQDRLYELGVDLIAGSDGDALAGALGFLAANGTTAGHLETTLPASVLTVHVPHPQRTSVTNDWPWMLRLVDAAGAVAARGWPGGVSGRVEVDLADDVLPDNAGRFVFEIDAGQAVLSPGGAGSVRVDVRDLARIYAGFDVRVLQAAGRLAGASDADVDVLAAACVSSPSMPFFF